MLTKLDGDTRGGAALSIKAVTGKPIKFSSVGEKLDQIEPFYPDRMASRILGMGDVLTLIDKATALVAEQRAADLEQKIRKNQFTLEDFLDQFQQMRKMGGMADMLSMLPGGNKIAAEVDEEEMKKNLGHTEAIILSMTPRERRNPALLNASRKKRIAAGSGATVQQVNQLLKQFEQTQAMMKQFGKMGKMGKKGRRLPFKF